MSHHEPLMDNIGNRLPSRRDFLNMTILGIGGAGLLGAASGCGEKSVGAPAPSPSETPPSKTPEIPKPQGEFSTDPTWVQDFARQPNGPIDTDVWRYELDKAVPTYNEEAQAYTSHQKNVRIENGALLLEAHREAYSYAGDTHKYKITSGRIDTKESFTLSYGKIEAIMKLPKGEGAWPAFWLLSANQPHTTALHPTDADWEKPGFYTHDGELDIMEAYGDRPGSVEGTVHTFNTFKKNKGAGDGKTVAAPDASEAFHTYGVELTPDEIVWTIDNQPYKSFKKPAGSNTDTWPFTADNELYVILNLAMGSAGGEPNPSQATWQLSVKKVAFYEYTGK